MIPTIPMYQIMETFANALANDMDLNDYCIAQFSKDLNIFLGYNIKNPITEKSCPYIVLQPDTKIEGANENPYQYNIPVGWAVVNEEETASGKITKLTAIQQCDAMGQLILTRLNKISIDHPIVSVEYIIDPITFFPQIAGQLTATIEVIRTMGAPISYP